MKTPFQAIPVIAFLNDMGNEQKLSIKPLPGARNSYALILGEHANTAKAGKPKNQSRKLK